MIYENYETQCFPEFHLVVLKPWGATGILGAILLRKSSGWSGQSRNHDRSHINGICILIGDVQHVLALNKNKHPYFLGWWCTQLWLRFLDVVAQPQFSNGSILVGEKSLWGAAVSWVLMSHIQCETEAWIGHLSINGGFFISIFDYQRVYPQMIAVRSPLITYNNHQPLSLHLIVKSSSISHYLPIFIMHNNNNNNYSNHQPLSLFDCNYIKITIHQSPINYNNHISHDLSLYSWLFIPVFGWCFQGPKRPRIARQACPELEELERYGQHLCLGDQCLEDGGQMPHEFTVWTGKLTYGNILRLIKCVMDI